MIVKSIDKKEILSWALHILAQSPTAEIIIEEALERGWRLGLEELNGPDFQIDTSEFLIILDNQGFTEKSLAGSLYFRNAMLMSLIRALRDVWQESRYGDSAQDHPPESMLALERVRAADLDVLTILIAWELRCEGEPELWRYMLACDHSDMAMRFSGYLERDPAANFTREALAAAFTQWFMNQKRVDACDHETLNMMDDLVEECEDENPFGRERLETIDIERLSCLPDRSAYLQGKGRTILSDPLYAGMDDEINQAHLMHIIYDLQVTYAGNVPFQNAALAERIFPQDMAEH
ncbi:MAG: DUF6782 family putative metallopeptidase [Alphaproteobacteria bacterium]